MDRGPSPRSQRFARLNLPVVRGTARDFCQSTQFFSTVLTKFHTTKPQIGHPSNKQFINAEVIRGRGRDTKGLPRQNNSLFSTESGAAFNKIKTHKFDFGLYCCSTCGLTISGEMDGAESGQLSACLGTHRGDFPVNQSF